MKFSLDDSGTESITKGVAGLFDSFAKAPLLRQLAEQKTGLTSAQIYQATQRGNKAGAEAENTQFTLGQRKSVPDQIAADPNMPDYRKAVLHAFGLTGDTNIERFAKAGGEFQSQGFRDQAGDNVDDLDRMNRFNTLAKPGKTYMPFDNIGNTGSVFSKATGDGKVADPTIAKIYNLVQTSVAGKNDAAAGLSNERVDAIRQGKVLDGTDEEGNPIKFAFGTSGEVQKVPGVAPFEKTGNTAAATVKSRAQVVRDVSKDFSVKPADREAEVERRMAIIEDRAPVLKAKPEAAKQPGMMERLFDALGNAKSPAPAQSAPKMDAQTVSASIVKARAAIASGAPRDAVIKRLKDNGIDPTGL